MDAKRNGSFEGEKIGSNIFLSHLLFINDILIFRDGTRRNAQNLI
jgi:hypothetical protein